MRDRVTAGSVSLHDGRRLAYRAIGPPDGLLVLYLHGAIGSPPCVEGELEMLVDELRIRYVMPSRPGFGSSDPAPGRTLRSFAGDAAALATCLGRERFAVIGVSAGGPYALACAHELRARIAVAAIVGCMAPGSDPGVGLPRLARAGLRCVEARPEACARSGDALLRVATRHPQAVAAIVRACATSGEERQAAERGLAAVGSGVRGMIDDHGVWSRPWGFRPADIDVQIQLWHGLQDALVPVDQALHLAAELPRVQTALHPDEGHFFYARRLREILGDLVAAAAPTALSRVATGAPACRP